MSKKKFKFNTRAVHEGEQPDPSTGALRKKLSMKSGSVILSQKLIWSEEIKCVYPKCDKKAYVGIKEDDLIEKFTKEELKIYEEWKTKKMKIETYHKYPLNELLKNMTTKTIFYLF